MCQMLSILRPPSHARNERPPAEESALALYPGLKGPGPAQAGPAEDQVLHKVALPWLFGEQAIKDAWNYKVPRELMAPQPPVLLPGLRVRPVPAPPGRLTPMPAPSTPAPFISSDPAKDLNRRPPASPPPSFEPPAPKPADPPKLPQHEALVPPDLKDIFKPHKGGDFTIPPGGGPLVSPGPEIQLNGKDLLVYAIRPLQGVKAGGVIGQIGKVDEEQLIASDPTYGKIKELAERAAGIVGPGKGPQRGTQIHSVLKELIRQEFPDEVAKKTIRVELTVGPDEVEKYGSTGLPRVDVFRDMENGELRVHEIKTGGAREKEARIRRLFDQTLIGKATRAVITEIWVE